ncbi:MAG: PKD domain-containing protein [Verrucomicrobiota bacterium]
MTTLPTILRRLVIVIGLLLVPGLRAATLSLGSASAAAGQSVTIPVTVNSGTSALGGYVITVGFSTNRLAFTGVTGGASGFAVAPVAINTSTPGQVSYIHQQSTSLSSPTGAVVVSQLNFTTLGTGSTSTVLSILSGSADNTDGIALSITATNSGTVTILGPPVANFTGTPTSGVRPVPVTFTDTSTGNITNRFWSFGDGSTTNTVATTITHLYTTASTNSVALTATGPGGNNTLTRANYIVVNNLPPQQLVTPASRAFGSLTVGQTGTLTFQVINTGENPLIGTASAASPYSITSGGSYNLAGGQTGIVTVAFSPVAAGAFNRNVIFNSNGGNSTNAVTGTGLSLPSIAVTPATLNFGTSAVGATTQLNFVISNTGQTPLTGSAVVNGGPYTIISGTPYTVPGLGSTTLTVQFAPVTVGTFSNSVVFTSNAGIVTNKLVGSGTTPPAADFTATPTTGTGPLTVTFTDLSTGSISNRFWSFGDGGTTNTTATSVTRTYVAPGTNTVTLIVSGPGGVSTNTKPAFISVVMYPAGDVNGSTTVTTGDALLINQVAVGLRTTNDAVFVGAGYSNGDVNQDGAITTGDSLLINQVAAGLRPYVVTKVLPGSHVKTVPTTITIYGVGFPTNTTPTVTIGAPLNLNLSNVIVLSPECIQGLVPSSGAKGTGTVMVVIGSTNNAAFFGKFVNQ